MSFIYLWYVYVVALVGSQTRTLNGRMISELERMWKEAVMA
jgi:hypothetical protein